MAATGVGALYSSGVAAATNVLMQKMLKPCVNTESVLFGALPPSFGGVLLGKSGIKGLMHGVVAGIISGPSTLAGNTFF